ncbi:probable O-methyltransferase 2 [Phragmites australis]|uniref:probable O-methyltransferase 2 n=1 Tax=Phragmites australis TaxID=29695 RepID=UPI002D796C40|nr:probable O-methyltransferase 2 [Phragmites australis]
MAAESQTIVVPTDAELLQAQADLWRHSLYYLTSMALKCAVELHIPTAIHNLGGATSLSDLVTALSLPPAKLPFLRRIMRLLVTSGIFASDSNAEVETFRLNPLSWLLVEGVEAEDHTYQKYFVLGTVSRHHIEAGLSLADWFKKDLAPPVPSPFEDLHGVSLLHENMSLLDKELDRIVNEGVAAHDNLAIGTIIRECHDLFKGLQSLTDCCGDGTTVSAIMKAFPHIKCTVLDIPKVIKTTPADAVNYGAGDMFKFVPPAQAVMLKLVLHFWNDEDCVKILEQCRKAIPSREEGGKVIIIEIVLSPSMGPIMYEAQLLMDMAMMVNTRGRQRDENDWREIFMKAGFSDYKIVKKIGARGIIEVYP